VSLNWSEGPPRGRDGKAQNGHRTVSVAVQYNLALCIPYLQDRDVELTAISFNSSPSSGRGGTTALSIRQNFAAAVAVPEWVKGKSLPKDSPAAYAIAAVAGKIITIGASFATDPSGPPTVDIRADGGGVLGSIDPTTITMGGGASLNGLDAATTVTKAVNGNLGLTYDISHGASKYTQALGPTSWFLCTAFLAFLNRQPEGKGNVVNCTDCATIVSSFANLLGCQLAAAVMASPGGFLCNKIIAIGGGSAWDYPFPPSHRFSYHEVAWTGAFSHEDRIFDACLLADNSGDPWNWTDPSLSHTPVLPLNEIFTSQGQVPNLPIPTPFGEAGYRERLAQNSAAGIGCCLPQGPRPNARGGRRGVF
jgi:hypothetical protein